MERRWQRVAELEAAQAAARGGWEVQQDEDNAEDEEASSDFSLFQYTGMID